MISTIAIILVVALLFLPWGTIGAAAVSAAQRFKPTLPSFNPLAVKVELPIWKVAVLIGAFWLVSGGLSMQGCKLPSEWPAIPTWTTKATAATYVWEKDQGGVPAAVMSGLNKLNTERKIIATEFERDTKNGNQQIPAQYKVAVEAAKELPALVAQSGDRVLKVTKSPKTEDDVLKGVP